MKNQYKLNQYYCSAYEKIEPNWVVYFTEYDKSQNEYYTIFGDRSEGWHTWYEGELKPMTQKQIENFKIDKL